GGTSDSSAAAIRSEDNGSNTFSTNAIDVPIILAPASGTTSTFFQAAGGLIRVSGGISGTGITLNLAGAGRIQLDVADTYTGGTTITGSGLTVNLFNNDALGSGTL